MLNETAKLLGFTKEIEINDGTGVVTFKAQPCHTNSHSTIHGGVLYAISEEAVGQYVFGTDRKGVAMEGSTKFYRPANVGDELTIMVTERKSGRKVGNYNVEITNQEGKLLCDSFFTIMFC